LEGKGREPPQIKITTINQTEGRHEWLRFGERSKVEKSDECKDRAVKTQYEGTERTKRH